MDINGIIDLAGHCLHLCQDPDMEDVVFSYLRDGGVFVTNNPAFWERRFGENGIKCAVKKPNEVKGNENIVVDGNSLGGGIKNLENLLGKRKKAICIYNLNKIEPSMLKGLVDAHDKMILSTYKTKTTIFSDKGFGSEMNEINPEILENIVKKELKNLLLCILLSKPMCGTDLVKILYAKFRIFISPGMLYPALHELEKSGLLKYEYMLKNKIYTVREKEQAKILLKDYARANSLLSQTLVSE